MLFSRGRYLGDRYFDQRIRKRRCLSEIRVDAGAESVHRAFPSARVSPISQGCGDNPLHDVSAHLRFASKLPRSLKIRTALPPPTFRASASFGLMITTCSPA